MFTKASDLTLTGKLFYDIPNPYHRVDTVKFKGFTKGENQQVRTSSGIACLFSTNSKTITVLAEYGMPGYPNNTGGIAARGFDLYIRKGNQWLWAGSSVAYKLDNEARCTVVDNMDGSSHECLLYLPLYSEVNSVKIGVDEGSVLQGRGRPRRGLCGKRLLWDCRGW